MATSVKECATMIEAVKVAGVRLSIGYRLHYDPFHIEMMRLAQLEKVGQIKHIILQNSMLADDTSNWRLNKKMAGGGPLVNNGIYCIQAALYLTGKFPIAVEASFAENPDPERFQDIEAGIHWKLYFEDGLIADCESHYTKEQDLMRVETTNGWFQLEPAFAYKGLNLTSSEGPLKISPINQQAAQLEDFSQCILSNKDSRVPAEMGLRDIEIIEAIYQSATTKKRISLNLEKYAFIPTY
jgi:predicted dehydrogenase